MMKYLEMNIKSKTESAYLALFLGVIAFSKLDSFFLRPKWLYLCTVKVEVSKIKMESQKEYEDKGCPKGIF